MDRQSTCGVAVCAALLAASPAALADAECDALTIAGDAETLPDDWRAALDTLSQATRQQGKPWSCARGTAELVVDEDGVILKIGRPGADPIERPVATPADVVPTGEALLAAPLPPEAPRSPAEDVDPIPPDDRAAGKPPPPDGQRRALLVDAEASTGFAGPTRMLWAGATIHGALRLDRWSGGVWVRLDAPYHYLSPVPERLSMSEVSVGLSLSRELLVTPFVLQVSLQPSFAVVSMEVHEGKRSEIEADTDREIGGAQVDFRVGAEIAAWIPLSPLWHAVVSLDGSLAPAGFGADSGRRLDPALPVMPAYGAGLSLGVGLSFR